MRGLVVPERTEDFTADPVELFFDLAFVFAFSQLVSHLIHDPTWGGAAEGGLLFGVLWFAWSTFTWAANAVSGNAREVRALFLIATAASIPMGASITRAFDAGGMTFALSSSVLILMAIGLQLWGPAVGSPEFQAALRYAGPNFLAIALLIGGGFASGSVRSALWIAFVLVLVAAQISAGSGDWFIRSGHFAERHGLIIIIALGEVIVALGIPVVSSLAEESGVPGQTQLGLAAAGAMAGLLWWGYFDRVLPALEHQSESLDDQDRGRFARDVYTWLHIPIVAGIIVTAAASEEILLHPKDPAHLEFRIMFAAGLALFFGGIVGCAYRAFRALAVERIAAIAAIVALAFLAGTWSGLALLLAVDVVLLVTIVAEHVRIEAAPSEAGA